MAVEVTLIVRVTDGPDRTTTYRAKESDSNCNTRFYADNFLQALVRAERQVLRAMPDKLFELPAGKVRKP